MVHGYRASTSYMDAQVGRVLDELDRLGLREKTIVVFWGDHGWQLGEHGLWCKHTDFETATRAPLIMAAPQMKSAGQRTRALVEFVDIYPTLAELAGLPPPAHLEGTSFAPLLTEPTLPWKKAAFSQFLRPGRERFVGRSVRTDRWRYTEWTSEGGAAVGAELYDHENDPGENHNKAGEPDAAATVKEMSALLRAGWKAAAPPR
jgi:arylsulfatase A-like enzyme